MPGHTPGPAPKTDVELGLAGSGFVTAHKTQAHVQVIKGDTQKADSAAVPDHLWVHAFLYGSFSLKESVGDSVPSPQGRERWGIHPARHSHLGKADEGLRSRWPLTRRIDYIPFHLGQMDGRMA